MPSDFPKRTNSTVSRFKTKLNPRSSRIHFLTPVIGAKTANSERICGASARSIVKLEKEQSLMRCSVWGQPETERRSKHFTSLGVHLRGYGRGSYPSNLLTWSPKLVKGGLHIGESFNGCQGVGPKEVVGLVAAGPKEVMGNVLDQVERHKESPLISLIGAGPKEIINLVVVGPKELEENGQTLGSSSTSIIKPFCSRETCRGEYEASYAVTSTFSHVSWENTGSCWWAWHLMVGLHRCSLMTVSTYWRSGPEPFVNVDVLRVQAIGTWCAEKAFSLNEGGRKENTGLDQIEDFNFGALNFVDNYEDTGGCHTGRVELLGREQRRSNRTQELLNVTLGDGAFDGDFDPNQG